MKACLLWLAPALALSGRLAHADDLNAGGLAPPPPVEATPPDAAPTPTEQRLDRADREDAKRGLEFVWLNAEGGFESLGLQTFHANHLVDANVVKSTQSGGLFGVGAGVRLIFITAGARFRLGTFSAWQLWTLDAELGLRIPLGALEPYFTFSGGYAALGNFNSGSVGATLNNAGVDANGLNVRGFNVRGGFGFDYYIGHYFSLGANLSGDLLFLSRSKVTTTSSGSTGAQQVAAQVYAQDGTSVGGDVALTGVIGLHF